MVAIVPVKITGRIRWWMGYSSKLELFQANAVFQERVLDSDALGGSGDHHLGQEHCGELLDYKINIVDTPGHTDFGGEVERIMDMVDVVPSW